MTGLYVQSNPTALSAQYNLTRNMGELSDVLTRLSTGLRINSGKDDPAGLIASELLKSDITGTSKAITNTQRANSMIATADSSMSQISNLLNDIKGLVVEAANTGAMSSDQIKANQLQVDASLESIDRIARSTTYGGQKLLDGSMDFQTDVCGGSTGGISNLQITSANFGTAGSVPVTVNVLEEAKRGTLIYNGTGVDQKTSIDVTGSTGTKSFTFGAGTSNDAIAAAINAASDSTGVQARVEGKESRGSVILSSAGQNNDILITANEMGLDAGNYTFRIVHGGTTNSVEVMSEPTSAEPGVVEIRLKDSYDKTYNDFAGMFNVTIDGQYAVDANLVAATGQSAAAGAAGDITAAQAQTSVTIQKGTANSVKFNSEYTEATGKTKNGTQARITGTYAANGVEPKQSDFNGWTISVDDSVSAEYVNGLADLENKTIRINSANAADNDALATAVNTTFEQIFAKDGGLAASGLEIEFTGVDMQAGDSLTLKGGGDAGELVITYKEGATANDIVALANQASKYASVSLKNGVDGSTLIADLPKGSPTHVETTWATAAGTPATTVAAPTTPLNSKNQYTSSVSASDVIELINSELGDMFTASMLGKDTGSGRVAYMDSAVDYGSVNLDNALRFTGMDDGPLVRLVTGSANQSLGLKIIQPSPADAALGIHTPILEVQLATDASGNSISSAADVAALFDSLSANETLGVSAEVLYPPGVDPNGGTWVDDGCGNITYQEGCPAAYGLGIVQPTGVPGTCETQQNDLVLLGQNETIVNSQAVARIYNADSTTDPPGVAPVNPVLGQKPGTTAGLTDAANILFGTTSSLNGVSFAFTMDVTKGGFNKDTGLLTMYIDPATAQQDGSADDATGAVIANLVDRNIAANWEAIREYTGATGDWTQAQIARDPLTGLPTAQPTVANAVTDAGVFDNSDGTDGISYIPPSTSTSANDAGTRGVGENDPVLLIKAKEAGTDMAGVTIKFVQNSSMTGYSPAAGNVAAAAGDPTAMDLKVTFNDDGYGNKTLVIEGNMGSGADGVANMSIDSVVIANSLRANADFNKLFTVETPLAAPAAAGEIAPGDGTGRIAFTDGNKIAGVTVGGYTVQSAKNDAGNTTSSGIGMTGQSDANERLVLEATDVGSQNFVKVQVNEGSFKTSCPLGLEMCYLAGTDVVATVNGNLASAQGNHIEINTADLAMSMDVDGNLGSTSFNITGGGALFQLGANVVSSQQMRIGIGSMMTSQLGGGSGKMFQLKTGGSADLITSDASRKLADLIVNEAISSVATTRGRLGAIQKSSLDPNISMLQDSLVALTEAEASYSNADFAEESSNMTRLQLLVQSGMSTLAIANQFPQYAAQLVR